MSNRDRVRRALLRSISKEKVGVTFDTGTTLEGYAAGLLARMKKDGISTKQSRVQFGYCYISLRIAAEVADIKG